MEPDIALKEAMTITGAIGASLVDYDSGMTLGSRGGTEIGLDLEVVRAKMRTMQSLGLEEGIEDILITLDTQYHLIRLVTSPTGKGLFFYLALMKDQANLAMARRQLQSIEQQLAI